MGGGGTDNASEFNRFLCSICTNKWPTCYMLYILWFIFEKFWLWSSKNLYNRIRVIVFMLIYETLTGGGGGGKEHKPLSNNSNIGTDL